MGGVAALACCVPLLAAAIGISAGRLVPPHVLNLLGAGVAAATAALCVTLLVRTGDERAVEWFGGWEPRQGDVALGISFTVDRFGAAIASLAAILVAAALAYSWRYFEESRELFASLVLLFLGAMIGFAFTGDLFNMFVFFELMSVAAFALTAYQSEEAGPIQGAINFAVTNSIGAFLILAGMALVYGRTGALNMAQVAGQLAARPADALVAVSFTLMACGFLVKAAVVPFHFWLADAHAVAPSPICVLFSGVMVELGVFAFARLYWNVFEGALGPHEGELRWVLLGLGALTAVVGAVMCLLQRHVKRMLAYSTISHVGVFLLGLGLLERDGLAGVAVYVLAHGLAKGALFLLAGVLLVELATPDELLLRGRARGLPVAGVLFALGAVALAGPPFLGVFVGKALLEERADLWIVAVVFVASALAAGAILRFAARVFLGWGVADDPLLSPEPEEVEPEEREQERRPVLLGIAGLLVAGSLVLGFVPGLAERAQAGAEQLQSRQGYVAEVLRGQAAAPAEPPPHHASASSVLLALLTLAAALGVAAWGLRGHPLPRVALPPLDRLRALHSGAVGDYVAWLVFGVAVLGGLVSLTVR